VTLAGTEPSSRLRSHLLMRRAELERDGVVLPNAFLIREYGSIAEAEDAGQISSGTFTLDAYEPRFAFYIDNKFDWVNLWLEGIYAGTWTVVGAQMPHRTSQRQHQSPEWSYRSPTPPYFMDMPWSSDGAMRHVELFLTSSCVPRQRATE